MKFPIKNMGKGRFSVGRRICALKIELKFIIEFNNFVFNRATIFEYAISQFNAYNSSLRTASSPLFRSNLNRTSTHWYKIFVSLIHFRSAYAIQRAHTRTHSFARTHSHIHKWISKILCVQMAAIFHFHLLFSTKWKWNSLHRHYSINFGHFSHFAGRKPLEISFSIDNLHTFRTVEIGKLHFFSLTPSPNWHEEKKNKQQTSG